LFLGLFFLRGDASFDGLNVALKPPLLLEFLEFLLAHNLFAMLFRFNSL